MASGGDYKSAFGQFATKADKKEATSKDITRWCQDAKVFGKKCSSNNLDIAFSAAKPKGKSTITVKELDDVINRISKSYAEDHKCSEDDAKKQIKEKLGNCKKEAHGTTKTSKTGGVDKMTDSSQYTGAHKERFGADGKGKGIEGRSDRAENTGYVGNYKGAGTYDKK